MEQVNRLALIAGENGKGATNSKTNKKRKVASAGKSEARAKALFKRAEVLNGEGRADEALAVLLRGLELQPGNVQALIDVGHIHQEAGRFMSAVDVFSKAVELDPTDDHPREHLSEALSLLDGAVTVWGEQDGAGAVVARLEGLHATGVAEIHAHLGELVHQGEDNGR